MFPICLFNYKLTFGVTLHKMSPTVSPILKKGQSGGGGRGGVGVRVVEGGTSQEHESKETGRDSCANTRKQRLIPTILPPT